MSNIDTFARKKIESLVSIRNRFGPIKNPNVAHRRELSLNDRVALFITDKVGTMWCAYLFAALALVALPGAISSHDPVIIVAWISQAFLQLILLPLIIVGQNLQGKHAEIRAESDFNTNVKAEKEIETILLRLEKQDEIMLDILHRIEDMERKKK